MIEAQQISLFRGGRTILDQVNLTLQPGTVTAILGPNGAGKTSLLRILSGEISPNEGKVLLQSKPLKELSIKDWGQRHAFLHQEIHLDFAFTAIEVVLLGRTPHMRGSESRVDWEMARQALDEVEFELDEQTPYQNLSGGEKQRIHLARALAQIGTQTSPVTRYLFLDEPTNNLDPTHQALCLKIARKIATRGDTVALILHDLNQAWAYSTHACLLNKGKVSKAGEINHIMNSPNLESTFQIKFQKINHPTLNHPILFPKN